jgi:outer membrane protein with beta-barrel domain
MLTRYSAYFVLCVSSFCCAAESPDSRARTGFWGGVDAGVGVLKRSYSVSSSTTETRFALALSGGYAWNPRLLLGVELGGWTLQESNLWDSSQGQGIETIFGIARYYPVRDSPLFVRGGGGLVKYWTNQPGESGASGWGGVFGVGYEVYANRWMSLAPSIEYSFGSFNGATAPPGITQDQRYQAVTLTFGITFR